MRPSHGEPVLSWRYMDWLEAAWSSGVIRGYPVMPPMVGRVEELLNSVGARASEEIRCTTGVSVLASQVAICAAMAACPIPLFPTVLGAVKLWARCDPRATDMPGCGAVPTVVLLGANLEEQGFATGYGALGPGGQSNIVVSATLGLLARLSDQIANKTAFGLPGLGAYCIAGRSDGLHAAIRAAAATLASPRGVYCGGAALQPARITRIMADALSVAMDSREAGRRAYLVVLSPKIAFAVKDTFAPGEFEASLEAAAGLENTGLDGLVVEAGANSQTWCALLLGPVGSYWAVEPDN